MKRSVLRIGCAVLSLSAAAGLLASCSLLPPASPLPDSKPAQAEEVPGTAAASLDDGKLRILYSNGSNGGNTVLCGNTVLYQAASSETVCSDAVRSWGMEEEITAFRDLYRKVRYGEKEETEAFKREAREIYKKVKKKASER